MRVGCDKAKYDKDYCGRKCSILDGVLPAPSLARASGVDKSPLGTIFFYDENEGEHACLSQWYNLRRLWTRQADSTLVLVESSMMASKARTFGDDKALDHIMRAGFAPAKIKQFGRMVQPFLPWAWERVRVRHVARGNYLKFSQSEQLKKVLLSTGEAQLAEASHDNLALGVA